MIPIINPYRFAAVAAGLHWIELGRTTLSGTSDTIDVGGASAGWSTSGQSDTAVDTTNNYLTYKGTGDDNDHRASYALTSSLSNTQWVMRFKWRPTTTAASDGCGGSYYFFGASDSTGAKGTSQDFIGIGLIGGDNLILTRANNQTLPDAALGGGDIITGFSAGTDYWIDIRRTASDTITATAYSDEFSTTTGTSRTYTDSSVSNITGLSYYKQCAFGSGSSVCGTSNQNIGHIDDLKIWDSTTTTSGTPDYSFTFADTLTAKPYMMILGHTLATGGAVDIDLTVNGDSGSNYAWRKSSNGGSDSTSISQNNIDITSGGWNVGNFNVTTVSNKSDQEKLFINHVANNETVGAGNHPRRAEVVGKWANTSNSITSVKFTNSGAGSYNTGSECVVLGYDPDDTEGGSKWEELANVTATSGTTISSGTFTAKKYLMFDLYFNAPGSGGQPKLQVGNSSVDTGSNYATRRNSNGTEDTLTSQDVIYPYTGGQNTSWYVKGFIINKSDKEKLFIMECNEQTTAGAGNSPTSCETVAKWANTSNQINIMQFTSHNSITISNAKLTVWGFD